MNEQTFLKEFYDQRINELGEKLKKLYEKKNLIGWLRLAALILTALAVYSAWNISIVIIIVLAVIGLSIFFFLVLRDADNREEIQNLEILEKLNKNELQYAEGNFDHSYDGKNLEPGHHAYAADLDLFGEFS